MVNLDEPPFLPIGTEVSAKFKGAFFEAKIRKISKSVKCKVQYSNGISTFVTDDAVKGQLKVGATVDIKCSDKKELVRATIQKIQDCSQYTVVFDDGDITCLKRTALCLKSGRHFADSATLDQLPLTHPEHIGVTPVKTSILPSNRSQTHKKSIGESEEEASAMKKKDIGKIVCVEANDKKKVKDNWFPGLIVAPTSQFSVRTNAAKNYLVRSFKDGKYYTVLKKKCKEFTKEIGARVENPTLKTAVDKALFFLDNDELPPHWDRDLLFGVDKVCIATDCEPDSDEPFEEKDHFVALLFKFMDDRGTPLNQSPVIKEKDVDLYKLFKVVNNCGGYNKVDKNKLWKFVAFKAGHEKKSYSSVKHCYQQYLHNFEDFYRKLGCTMLSNLRGVRSRSRFSRNIIRDVDKALPSTSSAIDKIKCAKNELKNKKNEDSAATKKSAEAIKAEEKLVMNKRETSKKDVKKKDYIANRTSLNELSMNIEDVPFDIDGSVGVGDNIVVYYGVENVTYEAKVISVCKIDGVMKYHIHYKGWNARYDEWIDEMRMAYKTKDLKPELKVDNAVSSKSSPPELLINEIKNPITLNQFDNESNEFQNLKIREVTVDKPNIKEIEQHFQDEVNVSDFQYYEVLDLCMKPPQTPLTNIFSIPKHYEYNDMIVEEDDDNNESKLVIAENDKIETNYQKDFEFMVISEEQNSANAQMDENIEAQFLQPTVHFNTELKCKSSSRVKRDMNILKDTDDESTTFYNESIQNAFIQRSHYSKNRLYIDNNDNNTKSGFEFYSNSKLPSIEYNCKSAEYDIYKPSTSKGFFDSVYQPGTNNDSFYQTDTSRDAKNSFFRASEGVKNVIFDTNVHGKSSLFDPNIPSCSTKDFYSHNIPSTSNFYENSLPSTSKSFYNSEYNVNSVRICEETIPGSPTGMSATKQSFCRPTITLMGATEEKMKEYPNILQKDEAILHQQHLLFLADIASRNLGININDPSVTEPHEREPGTTVEKIAKPPELLQFKRKISSQEQTPKRSKLSTITAPVASVSHIEKPVEDEDEDDDEIMKYLFTTPVYSPDMESAQKQADQMARTDGIRTVYRKAKDRLVVIDQNKIKIEK